MIPKLFSGIGKRLNRTNPKPNVNQHIIIKTRTNQQKCLILPEDYSVDYEKNRVVIR
jgi:hypothetical protein